MQWNVQGNELFFTCVHEIGHAVIFEALGVHIIRITVGPRSEGKCYSDPCSNRSNIDVYQIAKISTYAGPYFQRIFLQNTKEQEGDFYEMCSPGVYDEDFCEWLFFKNMKVREVDFSGYELPDPRSGDDEKQEKALLQTCCHINFSAVRAAIHALYDIRMRKGVRVMSGRKFRKIINDNGGLYASC